MQQTYINKINCRKRTFWPFWHFIPSQSSLHGTSDDDVIKLKATPNNGWKMETLIIIIIITVFIQRLTHRRLVYNGITQVWEVLEWRQSAANRKVQPAGSLQPTPPLWCTCPSRSWSQLCCLVGRGTCVWTTYPRLLRGMPRPGIELATFRSRVASANHWATAPHARLIRQ